MRRGHVRVDAERHGEGGAAGARRFLAEHGRGEEVGAAAAVLLVVLDAEEAERPHAGPDRLGDLPGLLPFLDMGLYLLLDEGAHRLAEHVVLFVEDLHVALPHLALTASRSTPPSAERVRASANTTTWGRLKRAIFRAER
jgi:hypothetical protein